MSLCQHFFVGALMSSLFCLRSFGRRSFVGVSQASYYLITFFYIFLHYHTVTLNDEAFASQYIEV